MREEKINPTIIVSFIFLTLFSFTCLGVSVFTPRRELVTGFTDIFTAFAWTMQGVLSIAAIVLGVALVAGLIGALFFGWQFSLATQLKVRLRAAEVRRAERDANEPYVTVAKPGEQVWLSEGGYHKPLHLTPGPVNAKPIEPTTDEQRRWYFEKTVHATARKPDIVGNPEVPMLEAGIPWPARINLLDLLPDQQGDLNNIVLGATIENGTLQTVSAPLEKMIHVAVGGASGWGKSEFLRAFAFQVATANGLAELALIDMEAATFSPLIKSNKLRYPIADKENDIIAILLDLIDEVERRRALFGNRPEVDKLSAYNRLTDEPLPIITVMIEEATVLLGENKHIEKLVRRLVLRGRKYGVFIVVGGQSWKASDFDSGIRGQFSSTVHFHARDKASSRVLLGDPSAADLDKEGRAYAVLPGHPMVEIQAPALSLMTTIRTLSSQVVNAPPAMPEVPEAKTNDKDQEFANLVRSGMSRNKAAMQVWGRSYGGDLVARGQRALGEI